MASLAIGFVMRTDTTDADGRNTPATVVGVSNIIDVTIVCGCKAFTSPVKSVATFGCLLRSEDIFVFFCTESHRTLWFWHYRGV